MHFSTLIHYSVALAATCSAGYVLEDDYMSAGFFDQFSFWDTNVTPDPTEGFVTYHTKEAAQSMGLINSTQQNARMSVDSTNVTPGGRPSVRITSDKAYDTGLVVIDIEHMPGGICGTWPAFWMLGSNWPYGGEIDIFEGVNDQTANDLTLHTGPGCSITNTGDFSGSLKYTSCDSSSGDNTGCQIGASDSNTYGTGFNANGGGVYATEWTDEYIQIFFFPRGSVPSDALGDSPNPSAWGKPLAKFNGGCDISSAFKAQQLVFDTTFCGTWAGQAWSSSSCASKAATCDEYVQNNPSAFADAYWSVNALKVYTSNGDSAPAPSTAVASSTSVVSVTQPASSTVYATSTSVVYVPHPGSTTFAISTKSSDPGYAPVVGPSGAVGAPGGGSGGDSGVDSGQTAPSSASQSQGSDGGFAPVVNPDGTVGGGDAQQGGWSTAANGAAVFERQVRHRRHLGVHKRGSF